MTDYAICTVKDMFVFSSTRKYTALSSCLTIPIDQNIYFNSTSHIQRTTKCARIYKTYVITAVTGSVKTHHRIAKCVSVSLKNPNEKEISQFK